jgi:lactoylglutathione lyase
VSNKIALTDVIIELHVPDFKAVKEFYSKLGFRKVWEYPPKEQSGYLVMKREKSIIAFFCGNSQVYNHPYFRKFPKKTPRGFGVEIAVYISDQPIEKYYESVIKKIGKKYIVEELKTKPWGLKDFRITDPFGYYLRFGEPENILQG